MISFSRSESQVTGFKIGRGEIKDLLAIDLLQLVLEERYDILKLKIDAAQSDVFGFLDGLGIPYNINSILLRNSFFFNDSKPRSEGFKSPYHFEVLDPGNVQFLDDIFALSVTSETGIVYHSWLQEALIDKSLLQHAALAYARSFATGEDGEMGWLIKEGDKYIGYNLGRKISSAFEGILIGVLPEYRNKGAASYVYQYFINSIFPEMGISHFYNDVQIQNAPSLKSTFKEKIIPSASWINVNLFPLLSHGAGDVSPVIVSGPLTNQIFKIPNSEESHPYDSYRATSIKNKNGGVIASSKKMQPIKNKNNILYRTIFFDSADSIAAVNYLVTS